jgi:hypothetical protein
MKVKDFDKFIIIGEHGPMAWDGEQLAYCNNSLWEDDVHAVRAYSMKRANQLIRKTKILRAYNRFAIGTYTLMPIKL